MNPSPTEPLYIVADLDFTILGGDYTVYELIPPAAAAALDLFHNLGGGWILNSGWLLEGERELVAKSPVKTLPDYLIGPFGSEIAKTTEDGFERFESYREKMQERLEFLVVERLRPMVTDFINRFPFVRVTSAGTQTEFFVKKDTPEFTEFLQPLYEDPDFFCWRDEVRGAPRAVIQPFVPSKGHAMREVLKNSDIDASRIIAAGDHPPDIYMMTPDVCAYCVCPANAHDDVKDYVRRRGGEVADLPYGLGVVQALHRLARRKGWRELEDGLAAALALEGVSVCSADAK